MKALLMIAFTMIIYVEGLKQRGSPVENNSVDGKALKPNWDHFLIYKPQSSLFTQKL